MTHKEQGVVSAASGDTPGHIAIVMDGNGRWARQQGKPRHAGHQAGAKAARVVIEESVHQGVEVLTLFAFSSENWQRPKTETSYLMDLFFRTLQQEARNLQAQDIVLRVIGDRSSLPAKLQKRIADTEAVTAAGERRLVLQVALSYGGRWDITEATRRIVREVASGRIAPDEIGEDTVAAHLAFADLPDVDLFIRSGGEYRMSNFILWQAAYAELYFTPVLWPDFSADTYREALADFARRQRRFGRTGEQLSGEVS